ncbi:MAG: serine/threonine-protein kinase [Polaromonas sp.]
MSLKKLGRYDLVRVLGKGAMGLVYEGRDPNLERRVAIKTIRVENLSEQAAADYEHRFRVEARSAARLQHPSIVSVYDSDRDGDIAFLVMEFIQGDDLKHHLDQGTRYSLARSVEIMDELLSALDYAHRQGIVHRDIKPANLLIAAAGRVKLTDFGVARMQDSDDATRTQGTMVGTLKYMSPEQVQGRPVDARADLFAAGIVLYQLLTGRRPFDGDSDFAVIQQVVGHSPAAPSSINPVLPVAMDAVVAMALAKSRDQRFASAQAFAAALQAASREAVDATLVPSASPPPKGSHAARTGTLEPGEAPAGLQSDISLSLSAVTQEVELVYWKDIRESSDIEDIQGFLAKFPAGIYADLALRRLRKLGVQTDGDCSEASRPGTATRFMPQHASQADKTVYAARHGESIAEVADPASSPGSLQGFEETIVLRPVKAPAAATGNLVNAAPAGSAASMLKPESPATVGLDLPAKAAERDASTGQAQRTASARRGSRTSLWALLGVAVLTAFGLGAKILWPSAEAPLPQAAALSDREEILPGGLSAGAAGAAPGIRAATAIPLVAASAVTRPAVIAPAEAVKPAGEKRPASEKKAVAKPVPVYVPVPGHTGVGVVARAPAEPAAAPHASAVNPAQSCEDRVLLGFQMCMAAQCRKPAFAGHPLCLERRAMEQRRREAQQIR